MALGVVKQEPLTRSHNDYVIAWISALAIESAAATMMLDEEHDDLDVAGNDSNTYTLGRIGAHNVVMACANEPGGVAASTLGSNIMKTFPNVRYILMVGIGGGIPSSKYPVRLGDIVVSEPTGRSPGVVQSDFGKWGPDGITPTGSLNKPHVGLVRVMGVMKREQLLGRSKIHGLVKHLNLQEGMEEDELWGYQGRENDPLYREDSQARRSRPCPQCKSQRGAEIHSPDPKVHYGTIASGNQVIKSRAQRDRIGDQLGACCVEMEAFGLMDNFPCLVIRGISDYADEHKNDRWQGYASVTAAAYAKELVTRIPSMEIENTPKMGQQMQNLSLRLDGIEEGIHEIKQDRNDLLKNEICEWLSPLQPAVKHEDTRNRLIQGTSTSLLEEFKKWRENHESFLLFALGIPGAGKTKSMSVLIDYLLQASQDAPKIGVAYVYMDINDRSSQTMEKVIGAIIKQLLRSSSKTPLFVEEAWRKRQDGISMDGRIEMLHEVCQEFDETFICIDALDEYTNPAEICKYFKPSGRTKFRLICTGREHIQSIVTTHLEESTVQIFRIRAQEPDIKAFIKREIDDARRLGDMPINSVLENEIVKKILELSDGVFLIPVLHIKLVLGESANLGERTITDCKNNLQSLQSGLNSAIDKMVERIENRELATSILAWVWLAARPLTVDELLHALAVRPGDETLNRESLYRPKTFLRCCLGMVTVDTETKTVRFFHSSLKDYFAERGSALGQAVEKCHAYIARTCLTYIQFQPICKKVSLQTKDQFVISEAQILPANPLLGYSSWNWGHHLRKSGQEDEELVELARGYIFRDPQERYWSHRQFCKHIMADYPGSDEEPFLLSFSEWHTIAFYGIFSLLVGQEPSTRQLDSKDSKFGRPPISWAAAEGHEKVVGGFLSRGADPDLKDYRKRTALLHAAANGHKTVVKILLENNVDINARDVSGGTALHWAALGGHRDIISLLLDNGANIHTEDVYGGTPLAWSIEAHSPTPDVIRLLLANSAEFDYAYGAIAGSITAIFALATHNDFQMEYLVELRGMAKKKYIEEGLLAKSIATLRSYFATEKRPPAPNRDHKEIYNMMASFQHTNRFTTVSWALDKAEDQKITPLSRSLELGNVVAAELLLEKGANPDSLDSNCRTPLSHAAEGGMINMVKLLLEKGADIDRSDSAGRTPLSYAVAEPLPDRPIDMILAGKAERPDKGTMEQVARILLEKGANINAIDKNGRTLLSHAAENGHVAIMKLLLRYKDVDPDSKDNSGRSPLSYAAANKDKKPAELLLREKSVNPDLQDNSGRTPLSHAAEACETKATVVLLLERNVKLDVEDDEGKTPLSYATERGHGEVTKMLVERGSDPEKKDRKGLSPFYISIREGDKDIVDLMLPKCDLNLDLNVKLSQDSGRRWSLLFSASRMGSTALVNALLDKYPNLDVNSPDERGVVPLMLAAFAGHSNVVRQLLDKGALPDIKTEGGMTPLIAAVYNGHTDAVKTLLENGAKPDSQKPYSFGPLSAAAILGKEAEAELLINFGADVNGQSFKGETPLHNSAYGGFDSMTKLFLDRGADPNLTTYESSDMALIFAVEKGHGHVIKTLLNNGANPYQKRKEGLTAMCRAVELGRGDILSIFFENGVDRVLWAVQVRHSDPEFPLLDEINGATDATDFDGRTALSHAVGVGSEKITKLLLAQGVSLGIPDNNGRTALFYAIDSGEEGVVTLLIEAGCSLKHKDNSRSTPLLHATATGKESMVQILLENGADIKAKNDEGKTALQIAVDKGFQGISQVLLTRHGGPYDRDNFHVCQKCLQTTARCILVEDKANHNIAGQKRRLEEPGSEDEIRQRKRSYSPRREGEQEIKQEIKQEYLPDSLSTL
ncbi:hypothetical protein TWF481_008325 [Arthrobotrys musiformis]|uniref:Nucleoside phosphorylase domain-containing protein n=1 Tax=Arthrobotrys musiformis TaxID=47236 RepID=A0AAV9W6S6_9PEZI